MLNIGSELFCGKIAQHIGVAKINNVPHRAVWIGKLMAGYFLRIPRFSRLFMIMGGITKQTHVVRISPKITWNFAPMFEGILTHPG